MSVLTFKRCPRHYIIAGQADAAIDLHQSPESQIKDFLVVFGGLGNSTLFKSGNKIYMGLQKSNCYYICNKIDQYSITDYCREL
jgi:hypothetical protein